MPRGVILDIDGTLVDTNYHHAIAWYMAFRQHEVTVPVWQIHRHIGMGGDQAVAALAGDEVEDRIGDALRTAHDVLYLDTIQSTSVFAGARELIVELVDRGHPVGLASSAGAQEVEHYLDLLRARDLVNAWTTADDVEQTKPQPDLVLAALKKLGVDEAVMIGDTPWDIKAATAAGVPTIAVLSGGFPHADLDHAGAAAVNDSVA
jgi:HAD superfamily hydrolase (TIGR01549 family)